MSVRNLEYSVSLNGITPANELFAGSQGDIKGTKVLFNITALHASLGTENLYYRFDAYDAEGKEINGEPLLLKKENGIGLPDFLYYILQPELTMQGGKISVYLIITEKIDDNTEMELYNFPARMRLNSLPVGSEANDKKRESLTTLVQIAKENAESAQEAAGRAVSAAEKLSDDKVFIFDGGEEEDDTEVDIEFESTDKPIENSGAFFTSGGAFTLKNEFDKKHQEHEKLLEKKIDAVGVKEFLGALSPTENKTIFKGLMNLVYPIGSVLIFHDAEDHTGHLGFQWERFATGRTLVGYDQSNEDFNEIDKTGGEKTHTLTIEELPKHHHILNEGFTYGKDWVPESKNSLSSASSPSYSWTPQTSDVGENKGHNNMPPYIVTSFWKRIK